ncbi:MAG: LON peptidase substrate-binding domain-containing protein [Dehalococcoidia bacterium]
MSESRDIPLFPLGTVLFPHQLLPLRIFEERYKLMIGECLRDQTSFGVVLIKDGREVGGLAVPHEIGTMARIVDAQRLEQGRINLKAIGERTFRLVRVTQQQPYMRAEVEFLDQREEESPGLDVVIASVKEHFSTHLDILSQLSDRKRVELNLDLDAESLSYLVAGVLAIENLEKQQLLEVARTDDRLQRELSFLNRENRTLQTFLYLRKRAREAPPDQTSLANRISPN